jgi:glutamine synthetase
MGSKDIEFLQIRYTDVLGKFLAKYIWKDKEEPDDIFKLGIGLDGSSVRGFADINESDLLLLPDRLSIRTLYMHKYRVTTAIADDYRGYDLDRLSKDPRSISQRLERYLSDNLMMSCQVGAEVECFIFDNIIFGECENGNDNNGNQEPEIISTEQLDGTGNNKYPIRRKGGYDAPPFQDSLLEFRFEVAEILKKYYHIDVTNLIHEVASNGQIEINFMHSTITQSADNVQIYKDVVRNVAKEHNKIANFMPKPLFRTDSGGDSNSDNGSGMHTSMSLWSGVANENDSKNIFYDEDDSYAELSQTARYCIGGILNHANSLLAITAPTVNSYDRMVPGFEAPIYIAWARGNRSTVIRVPVDKRNDFKSKRVESRAPDTSANPYLAFSAIVAAGIDGIKSKIDPGNPIDKNLYKMTDFERSNLGIKSLPTSLEESLEALKSDSDYLKICFPNELIDTYLMLKEEEIAYIGKDRSKARQFMFYYDI